MTEEIRGVALTDVPTNSQRMFTRYLLAVLIDLIPRHQVPKLIVTDE